MNIEKITEKARQGLVMLSLGAVASLIPFYFHTSAMTTEGKQVNDAQSVLIQTIQNDVQALEVQKAVTATETRQISERLERIERKIDRLIEQQEHY